MITTDTLVSHPLADRFTTLRLPGMRAAFLKQIARRDLADVDFEDRLALPVDRELSERRSRALQRRIKKARLHQCDACFEAIDLGHSRGLDRTLILGLGDCDWVRNGTNILITGPCGTGKSWIACALAHKACLGGYQALYLRMPRLLTQLRIAHGEGTIPKLYHDLARLDLIVLDDWGIATDRRPQAKRPGRDPRRPLQQTLGHRHQPDPGPRLAPPAQRPDPRRGHPRSPRPHRLSHRADRPFHARRPLPTPARQHVTSLTPASKTTRRFAPRGHLNPIGQGMPMTTTCDCVHATLSLSCTPEGDPPNTPNVAPLRVATLNEIARLLPLRLPGYFG